MSAPVSIYLLQTFLFTLAVVLFAGCQGGGGGDSASSGGLTSGAADGVAGIQLGGGGADGPVSAGRVEFFDATNNACGDVVKTDASGRYTALIPLDCTFPLQVSLTGGYDLVSRQDNHNEMLSLALDNGAGLANVTPLTTIYIMPPWPGPNRQTCLPFLKVILILLPEPQCGISISESIPLGRVRTRFIIQSPQK